MLRRIDLDRLSEEAALSAGHGPKAEKNHMSSFRDGRFHVSIVTFWAMAIVVLGVGVVAPRARAGGWTPSALLTSATTTLYGPVVATGRAGTTAYAWTGTAAGGTVSTFVAVKRPGLPLGPATVVSDPSVSTVIEPPAVAVDDAGTVTVAYLQGSVAYAATNLAGTWGAPQALSLAGAQAPSVTASGNRGAVVSWQRTVSSGVVQVEAAIRLPGGSALFGSAGVVSDTGSIMCNPVAAMDPAGDVALIWQRFYSVDGTHNQWVEEASYVGAGQPFPTTYPGRTALSSTVYVAGSGAGTCYFDINMTPAGRTLATWDYNNGAGTAGAIGVYAADRPAGAAMAWTATRLSNPASNEQGPQSAMADDGAATVVWERYADGVDMSATRTPNGAFGNPTPISAPASQFPRLAASPAGDAFASWVGAANGYSSALTAHAPTGGAFGDPAILEQGSPGLIVPSGSATNIGVDDQGSAYEAYLTIDTSTTPNTYRIKTTTYDATPPVLSGLSVPGSAQTGQGAGFSVSASDRATGVSGVHWTFGDGGAADGTSVSHAFGAAGTYTVTATATDAAGNAASAGGTITVTAPPPAGARPGGDTRPSGGRARLPGVGARASARWVFLRGGITRFTALTVSGVRKGDTIRLTCAGGGCRRSADVTLHLRKVRHAEQSLIRYVVHLRLRTGARLAIRGSRTGAAAEIISYTIGKPRKDPRKLTRCLDPGAARTRAC